MGIYEQLERINDYIRGHVFRIPKEPGITKIYSPGLIASSGKGFSAISPDSDDSLESKIEGGNVFQRTRRWYVREVLKVPEKAEIIQYTVPGVIASSGPGKSR